MRWRARAKSTADAKRSARSVAMPFWSTAMSERGTSSRLMGVIAPRSMRPIRSSVPFGRPFTSNGDCPARIV
jgi:hypothetical protein